MDLKEIQSLVKLVSSSKVDHLEIDKNDFSIKIKKNSGKTEVLSVAQAPVMSAPAVTAPAAPAASTRGFSIS